ncbi:MAG: hypothetical protein MJZ26_11325 [Fibrobacter sp.]|nr:hypothetical protein [Fibrobacter sp.]
MNRVSSTLALVLGAFVTISSAAQIQGFISGYAPGDITEKKEKKGGAESEIDLHSDFAWGLGAEFLVFPVGPLMVGGGLGYMGMQKDGDNGIVLPAFPFWASVGAIAPEEWKARPYVEARIGYPIPATTLKTWWNEPVNFFVMGNVGVQLPYHMGVEFNCTYLTMEKYFAAEGYKFRLNSLKFGGSITVHFDLFKNSAQPAPTPAEPEKTAEEPVAEEFSYGYQSDEQTAVEPVAEEAVADSASYGVPSEETPVEESAEPAPEEQVAPAEDAVTEESAEETPAEEPVAEAPVEEPAPEPAAEPAPEPEKKPVAKKKKAASKKKTTKKAPAKKTSKKRTTSRKRR